ncbi:MAG: ATP-binding protein [Bacteriovoracaceae bacterium]|nr:ATP-binding protein [Bacteriovoracaceae bacterium]
MSQYEKHHSPILIEESFLKVVMKNMTVRLTVIILVLSTISYFYFEQNIKSQLKDQIKIYTETKARNETFFYGALKDDLSLIATSFQKKMKSSGPNESYDLKGLGNLEKNIDGSIRNISTTYDAKNDIAIFIPNSVEVNQEYLRHLKLAKQTIQEYLPLYNNTFTQVWFVAQKKGFVSYAQNNPDNLFQTPANFNDTKETYYRITETDLNPDRKMVWTKPYFDSNLKNWMISLVTPVYENEIQVGSFGIDFLLAEINERIKFNSEIGITASIIDESGNIINHPEYNKEIFKNNGNYTIQETKDKTLNEIYTRISLISKLDHALIIETEHNKRIIGVAKIPSTPWFIITEQNTEHYANSIFGHLRFSIIISILSLFIEIIIIYRTLNKEVINPIQKLVQSIHSSMKNNFIHPLDIKRKDELGEMSTSYNQLIDEIKKKEDLITNYQNILEERVSKRTMQLNSALKHADEANTKAVYTEKMASLGEMASGIAHEINNPLQIIQLSLSTLDKMGQKEIDHERALKAVKKIDSTADRILEIIRGLDQFSTEKTDLPLEEKNLNELVQQSIEHMSNKLKDAEVKIDCHIDPLLKIFCLKTQIVQVFINLLQNSHDAIETLPANERWIKIWSDQNANMTFVYFQDAGKGIPLEIQQKLMTPFFTTKEIGKGTGLGLSIIKGIMAKHRGSVHYDNQSSHTTFVLKFPKKI